MEMCSPSDRGEAFCRRQNGKRYVYFNFAIAFAIALLVRAIDPRLRAKSAWEITAIAAMTTSAGTQKASSPLPRFAAVLITGFGVMQRLSCHSVFFGLASEALPCLAPSLHAG